MDTLPSDLDAANQYTARILETAAGTGDLITVREILSQWPTQPSTEPDDLPCGPKPSNMPYDQDLWPFTLALHKAIEENRFQIVSYVLSCGLKPRSLTTLKALNTASIDIFQALLDHEWDINAPLAPNMCPPLCYVITNEHLVHWFLSHGASPDAAAPQNARTPVASACAKAPLEIVRLFYAYDASHLDVLQSAAESPVEGRLDVMRFLLDGGANIDAVKWEHNEEAYMTWTLFGLGTALHYAAKGGYADRVELLLKRGAKVDVMDSNGETPLEVARRNGRDDVIALLTDSISTLTNLHLGQS